MVCYFTGTGNSRHIAVELAQRLNDSIYSLNDRIKTGARPPIRSEKPLVFVFPIYAWRAPRIVASCLRNMEFPGNRKAYFVATMGSHAGDFAFHAKRLCQAVGLQFMGAQAIKMPENYIRYFSPPDEETARGIIAAGESRLDALAERIRREERWHLRRNPIGILLSAGVSHLFYAMMVRTEGFHTTENCVGCGLCAKLCPLNNVILREKRPTWGLRCTHCMACISGCPQNAVEYGKATRNRNRYYLPLVPVASGETEESAPPD